MFPLVEWFYPVVCEGRIKRDREQDRDLGEVLYIKDKAGDIGWSHKFWEAGGQKRERMEEAAGKYWSGLGREETMFIHKGVSQNQAGYLAKEN